MIDKFICKSRQNKHECRYTDMYIDTIDIILLEKHNKEMEKKIQQLKQDIFYFTIYQHILDYECDNLEYDLEAIRAKYNIKDNYHQNECSYNPKNCKEEFKKILDKRDLLVNKIQKYYRTYNQYVNVIKDVKIKNKKILDKSKIYFKFGFDNKDNLICAFFDYNNYSGNLTLYVFYGDHHKEINTVQSEFFMYLNYYHDGSLEIVDTFASQSKKRCGHGTFALRHLDKIVSILNKEIVLDKCSPITIVSGSLYPGPGISMKDLIKFYDKSGYITNGYLLKIFTI